MRVSVVGHGMVGAALHKAAKQKGFTVKVLDPFKPEVNDGMAILDTEIAFISVPTPTEGRVQSLHALHNVLGLLSTENYQGVVAIKSTVLPGTTDKMADTYKNLKLCHNPEFLKERTAFEDTMNQPAILIGYRQAGDLATMLKFWQLFDSRAEAQTLAVSPKESEMAKYMHNCFLATKVSFFNEMAELCERLGIKYEHAIKAATAVGQIGQGHTKIALDGKPGFGGSCFPKDTKALEWMCQLLGVRTEVLSATINGNKRRRPDV